MIGERINVWYFLKVFLIAILLSFVLRAFFIEPTLVKGASMKPALQDNDRLLISKMAEPNRFDIIVFHTNEGHDFVKRVIGLPGDAIEYKDDTLYINGEPHAEPYLDESKESLTDVGPLTNTFKLEDTAVGEEVVPDDHLFVMGDNRRNSMDSRQIGAVSLESVVGVSKLIFFPFKDIRTMSGSKYRVSK